MKKSNAFLLVLLAAFILGACSPNTQRTIAKGKVLHVGDPQPYKVLIRDFDKKGNARWIRWTPWEMQDIYELRVMTNDQIQVVWISVCDGDTLATLTAYGNYNRQKIKKDILLDGSHYVRGVDPRRTETLQRAQR